MAYQLNGAQTLTQLADTIRTFAAAQGMTASAPVADTAGTNTPRDLIYYNYTIPGATRTFYIGIPSVTTLVSQEDLYTSFVDGTPPGDLTPNPCRTNSLVAGVAASHLFSDGTSLHCVAEYAAGSFRHFGFGIFDKIGTYTGGDYVYGTFWSQSASHLENVAVGNHQIPLSGKGNVAANGKSLFRAVTPGGGDIWEISSTGTSGKGSVQSAGLYNSADLNSAGDADGLARDASNSFNNRALLMPLHCFAYDGTARYYPVGFPAIMRRVHMGGLAPAEVLTLGADEWVCFPAARKTPPFGENSRNIGYAYKK